MACEISFISVGEGDVARERAFYAAVLGWRFEDAAGGAAIAGAGVPAGVHGGDPEAGPYVFLRVDDLEAALARIRELDGARGEFGEEREAGDDEAARFGRFVWYRDDRRSGFGLHEPPARVSRRGSGRRGTRPPRRAMPAPSRRAGPGDRRGCGVSRRRRAGARS